MVTLDIICNQVIRVVQAMLRDLERDALEDWIFIRPIRELIMASGEGSKPKVWSIT
jgi:hypothetical protein